MIAKVRGFLRLFYSVPWCVPAWGWNEFVASAKAVLTGTVVHGDSPEQFGRAVSNYLGLKFAVPVNRGRTAIELGLRAIGVGAGDDVILPSFVCRSVLDGVLSTGATPVFADIDETLNVTPSSVELALTPATKCVIVAHLFGRPAAIDQIEAMLATKGIALMDDAAQALGASRGGRLVGSFGACGIVSCGPGKPLAGAAGGLLVTNDRRLYERAIAIRPQLETGATVGRRTIEFWMLRRLRRYTLAFSVLIERMRGSRVESAHVGAGLSNLDGAVALAQFDALHINAAQRRWNARLLKEVLTMLPGRLVTDFSPSATVVKFVHLLPESGPSVEEAIDILAAHGIEAQGGYSPLHDDLAADSRLPKTAAIWRRVLCVPVETRADASRPIQFLRRTATANIEAIAKLSPL